jgi:hypothetical protein
MAKTSGSPSLPGSLVGSALDMAKRARTLPVGALLGLSGGLALTAVLHYALGDRIPLWLLGLSVPFTMVSGIGIQKLLHWKFGWKLDTELEHARSKHQTDLKLTELKERLAAGVLTPEQAQRIGAQLAREGLLGPPRLRGPRPPRRKNDSPRTPESAAPLQPAA